MDKKIVIFLFAIGLVLLYLIASSQPNESSVNLRNSAKSRRASIYWTDDCKAKCMSSGGIICGRISRSCCHRNSCQWGFCRSEIKLAWCL